MYNYQNSFGHFSEIPVCNTIKKILIGKLVTYHSPKDKLVIIGVRRNNLYGHLEILLGRWHGTSVSVMSWYSYHGRNSIMFIGRDSREVIRKCVKTNPKYISYHVGKRVNLIKIRLYEQPPLNYQQGEVIVYDNYNLYKDYCNLFN